MKKKNGFTLVEIISVIGILLLITAITIPSIATMNKRNKEKEDERIIENIKTSSESFIERYRYDIPFNQDNEYYFKLNILGALELIKLPIKNYDGEVYSGNECIKVTRNDDWTLSYDFPINDNSKCSTTSTLSLNLVKGNKIDVERNSIINLDDYVTYESDTTPKRFLKLTKTGSVNTNVRKSQNVTYNVVDLLTGTSKTSTITFNVIFPLYKDTSKANYPDLAEGLIPVVYDDTNDVWKKADIYEKWYDYSKQWWANAVTVTSTNRSKYMKEDYTGEIPMDEINSMWVWIPRYKYKIPSGIGVGTEDAPITEPPQIDVVFETGTAATGVTETVYRNGIKDDGTNTNYYTHPAFRNVNNIVYDSSTYSRGAWDEEITGFWVQKFQGKLVPDKNITTTFGGENNFFARLNVSNGTYTSTKITFNVDSSNQYGLNTTKNTTDSHLMKNTEWGAVAYLSQSQYGKKGNANFSGKNKEVYANNGSGQDVSGRHHIYTGRSSGSSSAKSVINENRIGHYGYYSYNDKTCLAKNTQCTGDEVKYSGTGASTTGTIYGVYDMSGSHYEWVAGFIGTMDSNGSMTINNNNIKLFRTTFPPTKYYDSYIKGKKDKQVAILGDATWETMYWYSDNTVSLYEDNRQFQRGGYSSEETTGGIFSYKFQWIGENSLLNARNGDSRAVLIP